MKTTKSKKKKKTNNGARVILYVCAGAALVMMVLAIIAVASRPSCPVVEPIVQPVATSTPAKQSVEISLSCTNNYTARATYYSPDERGVMDKLALDITKDGLTTKYEMVPAISASGSKFENAEKTYSFWEHQGEFTFAAGDNPVAVCRHFPDGVYYIDGQPVSLIHGESEKSIPDSSAKIITKYFGNEVTGDFNNDGYDDVFFLLTQETGGSGVFYYVAMALGTENGVYKGTTALLLGDRIAPQITMISEDDPRMVIVSYADRKPGQSMSAKPSFMISRNFRLDGNQLIEVENKFPYPAISK